MGRRTLAGRWAGRSAGLLCAALAITATLALSAASAHQTAQNKGVSVTMHVAPEDAPSAGSPAKISVKVRARNGRFRWKTCVCYLNIKDSSGRVVLNRRASKLMTFTFPRSGAYRLTFAGFVNRKGKRVHFSVRFAIRAG